MSRIRMIAALGAALMLGACSYSAESNFLGYRSSSSFSTPGAGPPAYYAQPPAYSAPPASPGYSEAPAYYAPPPPAYYAPPAYIAPSFGISIGPRWGWRGRRWR